MLMVAYLNEEQRVANDAPVARRPLKFLNLLAFAKPLSDQTLIRGLVGVIRMSPTRFIAPAFVSRRIMIRR